MRIATLLRFVLGALASQAVQAVPLPFDSFLVPLPGTTVAAEPNLAGTIVEDLTTPFHYLRQVSDMGEIHRGPVDGSVQSRVVKSIDGTFDFYWRVKVTEGIVSRLALSDAGPFTINANWRADGLGTHAPTFASRAFGAIEVLFVDVQVGAGESGGLDAPDSSSFFFLDTDARGYNKSGRYQLDSSLDFTGSMGLEISGSSERFATFAPVPEPRTYALMLLGLAALAVVSRRRTGR